MPFFLKVSCLSLNVADFENINGSISLHQMSLKLVMIEMRSRKAIAGGFQCSISPHGAHSHTINLQDIDLILLVGPTGKYVELSVSLFFFFGAIASWY